MSFWVVLLAGIPVSEDELMFAVAVIGPYNAMTNYKYKVKVTPGTAKRGKAAKTTLSVFGADRAASGREKDLLKSLKDQDVSRNLPGKVKISAPQLQKSKAKAKNSWARAKNFLHIIIITVSGEVHPDPLSKQQLAFQQVQLLWKNTRAAKERVRRESSSKNY